MKKRRIVNWKLLFLLCSAGSLTGCGREQADFLLEADSREQEETEEAAVEISEEQAVTPSVQATPTPAEIYVDVCGAVADPGVYVLEADSRIFQAIEKAGGYLPEAAAQYVNQAQQMTDGQQIYVPTKEEASAGMGSMGSPGNPPVEGGASGTGNEGQTAGTDKVNINTADVTGLTALSGIGEAKAQAIIAYREENGGFASIEEIMNVQGIKEGTFQQIKDEIAVE